MSDNPIKINNTDNTYKGLSLLLNNKYINIDDDLITIEQPLKSNNDDNLKYYISKLILNKIKKKLK